ncbi:MAG: holin family protein [Betaproteobacteria bacterium]|nr:holin family protein [Betaproteobacteria bacterium]
MWSFLQPLVGPIVNKLVDLIPDPNARAKAKEEFERELLTAVTQASQAQTKINEIEAQHSSIFVAGWRPFIGWVCGIGLLWAFILQPIFVWSIVAFDLSVKNVPQINSDGLYQLVLAMLGMGGLRTFEKMKGVARETKP